MTCASEANRSTDLNFRILLGLRILDGPELVLVALGHVIAQGLGRLFRRREGEKNRAVIRNRRRGGEALGGLPPAKGGPCPHIIIGEGLRAWHGRRSEQEGRRLAREAHHRCEPILDTPRHVAMFAGAFCYFQRFNGAGEA